ncbi:MAG: lysostaphin resistance A-like protein, partial [Wujia sp.]
MKSKKAFNIRDIFYIFMPLIVAVLLQFLVNTIDVIIIFMKNALQDSTLSSTESVESIMNNDYNQPMNLAYLSVAQYAVYILVMGIWFYHSFCRNSTSPIKAFPRSKSIKIAGCLIGAGIAGQFLTDAVLTLIRNAVPRLFTAYDDMVARVTGVYSSWVMLIAIFLLAPIAEEILFRGLIYRYSTKVMGALPAILLNGLLFAVYHGN